MKGKKGQDADFSFGMIMKIVIAILFFVVICFLLWFNRHSISDLFSGAFTSLRGGS